MSDTFDITALPFAVGDSPLHLKGNFFIGELEYIDKHVPGGREAVIKRVKSPACQRFLQQRFLAASWYDVYKLLLEFAKPEMVVERLPRVATQYFDFVEVSIEKNAPGDYTSRILGMPTVVSESYMAMTEAFLIEAVTAAGAEHLEHEWLPPEPGPISHKVETVKLARRMRWDV